MFIYSFFYYLWKKKSKYEANKVHGNFLINTPNEYNIVVHAHLLGRFFLLTAEAINKGKKYQLDIIADESRIMVVGDISGVKTLLHGFKN